jgi:Zn-dependent protease
VPSAQPGTIRLFRFAGIQVFLHWSWFLVALYEINNRKGYYGSPIWNAAEYVALFAIVLLHEFGHSLACRQVGGQADRIILWPLGGIAFVAPPPRPGANLWSIAAGPLVNAVLVPLLYGLTQLLIAMHVVEPFSDPRRFLHDVQRANLGLLIFNLLPIFPLDGGQILRALLWFRFGPARSLLFATIVGFLGMAGIAVLAVQLKSWWIGVLVLFLFSNCYNAFNHARAALRREPRPGG